MGKTKKRTKPHVRKEGDTHVLDPGDVEGDVYFLQTSKGIYPYEVMKRFEQAQAEEDIESQQLEDEKAYSRYGLKPYPFEVQGLLLLQENCGYFDACVKRIAKDVVGQGYEIKLKEGAKEDDEEKDGIQEFLESVNDKDETIEAIIEKGLIDWGVIGWYGIEVSRNREGTIDGLWHIPAHTFKIHKAREKFAQMREEKYTWFKAFGSEENISSKTGDEIKGPQNLAHELIYHLNYYQRSSYYGAPNIISSLGAVRGLIGIRDFNLAFFENYGVPAALIILKGKWKAEAEKKITDFIDVEIKGTDSAHKTMVLKVPREGEVRIEKLSVDIKEGSFRVYQKGLRDEVLVAYTMPPYRIGIAEVGSLGGSTAKEMTPIYVSSVITPQEKATAAIINKQILQDGLGVKNYEFVWKKLDTRDLDAMSKRQQILFSIGAMNPNQIRAEYSWEPYEGGNQFFVGSNYLPIGEEDVEKRERALAAEILQIKQGVDDALENINQKLLAVVASKPEVDEEGQHG